MLLSLQEKHASPDGLLDSFGGISFLKDEESRITRVLRLKTACSALNDATVVLNPHSERERSRIRHGLLGVDEEIQQSRLEHAWIEHCTAQYTGPDL